MHNRVSQADSLRTIPRRKLLQQLDMTPQECGEEGHMQELSDRGRALNEFKRRCYDANIPLEYWRLRMDDFKGSALLKKKYEEIVSDLDKVYNEGLTLCLAGAHGRGKMIALDTDLPTPNGFIKLIDLKEGDELFDERGKVCKVTKLHPIDLKPKSYEVVFDDGTIIKACADHLWLTWDRHARKCETSPKVITTQQIKDTLRVGGIQQIANHSVPCAQPLDFKKKNLLIDPYVLGVWLGDGSSSDGAIECADVDILDEIKKAGYEVILTKSSVRENSKSCRYRIGGLVKDNCSNRPTGRLKVSLREMGLIGNKHIPEIYLRSSIEQRLSLLQGLMDTDGCCLDSGRVEFCSTNKALAYEVGQLVWSLGIKCNVNKNESYLNGKRCSDRYRVAFTPTNLVVFRLGRKKERQIFKKSQMRRTTHRYIKDVREIDPVPMRCITVDSPSHLFLVTKQCIPTHNTMVCANILKEATKKGYQCLYVTLSDIVSNALSNSSDKYTAKRELMMTDFLVIDEFDGRHMGSGAGADLFGRLLEDILRKRIENHLPLFMCTNSTNVIDSFEGDLKQSIGSLMSRVDMVPVLGKDFRKGGV